MASRSAVGPDPGAAGPGCGLGRTLVGVMRVTGCALAVTCQAALAANFSQHPGFAELLARVPPESTRPDHRQRALLERHRPRFHLPDGHSGLLDFYRDYVAEGTLRAGNGSLVSARVNQKLLNRHKRDPEAVFVHRGINGTPGHPVVYARIDPLEVHALSRTWRLLVLTYHAVFRTSGLPAGLGALESMLLGLVADLDDWHQLDHYTAVSVVLDESREPVAIMFQQHNYTRTHLFGESVTLPADGRPRIDVSVRSNELYPHRPGAHWRRAVRFADAAAVSYLMGFGSKPLLAAPDLTHPASEPAYALAYLPHDDAFYLFAGYLGERRLLPGRDGPPGAYFNTLPALRPLEVQLFVGYWRDGNREDWQRYRRLAVDGGAVVAFAGAQREIFFTNLDCLRAKGQACK